MAVVAVALSALVAPAGATRFEPVAKIGELGPLFGGEVTAADGERYMAFMATPTSLRVRDEAHAGRSFAVPTPAACGGYKTLVGMGGGQLAIQCEPPDASPFRLYVLSIATRTWQEAAGADGLIEALRYPTYGAVGANWIRADLYDGPSTWLNWRTGERRTDDAPATATLDPDLSELVRPLCAPLRRTLPLTTGRNAFEPYAYEPPFGMTGRSGYGPSSTFLAIQRCGDPRPTVLDRGSGGTGMLGAGIVTWMSGSAGRSSTGVALVAAHAHLGSCRATLTWIAASLREVVHAGRAIYRVDQIRPMHAEMQVRRLLLPRGCPAGERLRVTAPHAHVVTAAVGGDWKLPSLAGARVRRIAAPGVAAPRIALQRGALVDLGTGVRARTVRWRVGGGTWHASRRTNGDGRHWQLNAPPLGAGATLAVEVTAVAGGSIRFVLRPRPA